MINFALGHLCFIIAFLLLRRPQTLSLLILLRLFCSYSLLPANCATGLRLTFKAGKLNDHLCMLFYYSAQFLLALSCVIR